MSQTVFSAMAYQPNKPKRKGRYASSSETWIKPKSPVVTCEPNTDYWQERAHAHHVISRGILYYTGVWSIYIPIHFSCNALADLVSDTWRKMMNGMAWHVTSFSLHKPQTNGQWSRWKTTTKNAFPALRSIVVIKLMSRWDKRFLPV